MSPRILVAGIGNIFLGDDGFGVEVAIRLAARTSFQELRVKDFGIRGLDLAYAMMDDWELVIMVDAVSRGGKPGSLYVIEPDITDIASRATLDAHAMTPGRVLQLITVLGGRVPRTIIVGCEPAQLGGEEGAIGLSDVVEAAVQPAVTTIERLMAEALATQTQTAV